MVGVGLRVGPFSARYLVGNGPLPQFSYPIRSPDYPLGTY